MFEGKKFSKSNNIGIFGDDCQKTGIKSDVWRFALLSNRP
jgi:methionyl-tRNA synthetase